MRPWCCNIWRCLAARPPFPVSLAEESIKNKRKGRKSLSLFTAQHLIKTNLAEIFSEARSGTIAHKNKTKNYCSHPLLWSYPDRGVCFCLLYVWPQFTTNYKVPSGNQEFCLAPSKTIIVGQVVIQKIMCLTCTIIVWWWRPKTKTHQWHSDNAPTTLRWYFLNSTHTPHTHPLQLVYYLPNLKRRWHKWQESVNREVSMHAGWGGLWTPLMAYDS